jgi:hypothetical protein
MSENNVNFTGGENNEVGDEETSREDGEIDSTKGKLWPLHINTL